MKPFEEKAPGSSTRAAKPSMKKHHHDGDLAARATSWRRSLSPREAERTGQPIFPDARALDPKRVRERFPTNAEMCRQVGLDLADRSDSGGTGPRTT
jgi:aspartate oxidase